MKANVTEGTETPFNSQKESDTNVTCSQCGRKGPKARKCFQNVWCGHSKQCNRQVTDKQWDGLCTQNGVEGSEHA